MQPLAPHPYQTGRQLLNAMCAQAHGQLAVQRMTVQPQRALQAQANIDLHTTLALLNDGVDWPTSLAPHSLC